MRALPDVTTINVEGLGRGSVEEMGEAARPFFKQDLLFHSLDRPVHFVGHSMGGIVARYLLHQPEFRDRVSSLVTLGTPHLGLQAAHAKDVSRRMRLLRRLFEVDFDDQSHYYISCRTENMLKFNAQYPDLAGILYASALGVVKRPHLPLTLKIVDAEYNSEISDGLVPESSQNWGQSLGRFHLDHLEQIGLCQDFNPIRRAHFNFEFRRLCETLSTYWHSFPSK